MVGSRVVILGSGDIGLIMARRMTLEGAKVLACVEVMPYSGGLTRNIVQCLHDYDIPLYLSHTVTEHRGRGPRGAGRACRRWMKTARPVPGTEMIFDCDTLLLSRGADSGKRAVPAARAWRWTGAHNGPVVYENMETSRPGRVRLRATWCMYMTWWTSSRARASARARPPPGMRTAGSGA